MKSPVRRSLFGLLALVAVESAVLPHAADAALRGLDATDDLKNTCVGKRFPVICQAGTLIRAGRITLVQTTLAFARVIKHEALAYDRAADAARSGTR